MISVIICSRTKNLQSNLVFNIEKTIGIKYELIVVDNSKNELSIYEAYNIGINQSVNEFLCVIHDDIYIYSNNWGEKLQRIFENDRKIALIGVAGSKIKTKMPLAWWDCPEDQKAINIIQHFSLKNKKKEYWNFGYAN